VVCFRFLDAQDVNSTLKCGVFAMHLDIIKVMFQKLSCPKKNVIILLKSKFKISENLSKPNFVKTRTKEEKIINPPIIKIIVVMKSTVKDISLSLDSQRQRGE